jgi:hypothetical protein
VTIPRSTYRLPYRRRNLHHVFGYVHRWHQVFLLCGMWMRTFGAMPPGNRICDCSEFSAKTKHISVGSVVGV